jgi:hypothetical protein
VSVRSVGGRRNATVLEGQARTAADTTLCFLLSALEEIKSESRYGATLANLRVLLLASGEAIVHNRVRVYTF